MQAACITSGSRRPYGARCCYAGAQSVDLDQFFEPSINRKRTERNCSFEYI